MIVRRLEEKDLRLRIDWMNNPKIYSSMHFDIPLTMEDTFKWFIGDCGNLSRADFAFEEVGKIVTFGGLTEIHR